MKESLLLRFLDRYVGSLVCFIFSLVRRRPKAASRIDRVLLIELFEMGASIMAIPAIQYIKSQRPQAEIFVLTIAANASSWEISGLIPESNILCLDGRGLFRFLISAIRQVYRLRSLRIDLTVDFEKFSRISVILATLAGSRRIAGFYRYEYEGLYRGERLIDARCSFNQNLHIAQNFMAVAKVGLKGDVHHPNLKESIDPDSLTLPRQRLGAERIAHIRKTLNVEEGLKIILIAPDVGGNLQVRNYPVYSYAKVAQALLDSDPYFIVMLIGVKENQQVCSELERLIGSTRCRNMCGSTHSLRSLMELISISELLIGNDNGPLHFASLTDTKILGIFSTDSPMMYGPLGECVALYTFSHCSPCISALNHKRSKCESSACIKDIPPSYVVTMAKALMANQIPTRTVNGSVSYLIGKNPLPSLIDPLIPLNTRQPQPRLREDRSIVSLETATS